MLPHKHLLIRAEVQHSIQSTQEIEDWMIKIIKKMRMNILFGPVAKYVKKPGNTGLTCFAIIDTSHIVLHTWDDVNPYLIQFDVYTCSDLDVDMIFEEIKIFKPLKIDYKFLDREQGLKNLKI